MRVLVALLLCVVGLSQSTLPTGAPRAPLSHDAYIWQRVWTPRVIAAAGRSADLVRSWRVLLAEADRSGRWVDVAVPWPALQATGRPAVAVIRIDGRLDEARMPMLLDRIVGALDGKTSAIAGLEIDYDCPTSRLPGYARFLAALRQRLPATLRLSITALPTWMNAPELGGLGASLDELVLQVHAVDDPRRGLFDPDRAERWIHAFARRIGRPMRVALPAYDVRVTWRDGRLASVEGEVPLLTGATGTTLRAAPEAVLGLLHRLQHAAPDNLAGIVWFRLPTDSDRRAWSLDTWRAVVTDRLPPPQLSASLVATDQADLWTVVLANDGAVDASLPRRVVLDPACAVADSANGFRLVSGTPLALEAGDGRLRPHNKRVIGWARCTDPQGQLHVTP
jgi:hypothetical protein